MHSGLIPLRSFVVTVWLLVSITHASLSANIQFSHLVPRIRNGDSGRTEPRNSIIEQWLEDSLSSSRYVLRDLQIDDPVDESNLTNELLNPLEGESVTNEDVKLFRRAPGSSRSRSSSPERKESSDPGQKINIYVVPYYRGRFKSGGLWPYHWAIFLTTAPDAYGTAYQLRGMPGEFRYDGPERPSNMAHSRRKRQELLIGSILNTQIKEMEEVIAQVPISKVKGDYNCQTWSEMVLQRLNQHGWLTKQPSTIVSYLKQQESAMSTGQTR